MGLIVGYETEKNELRSLTSLLLDFSKYEMIGIRPPRGVILFGEPGVGKTELVKTMNVPGIEFYSVYSSAFAGDQAGDVISDIFSKAKNTKPSVIFFDELDKVVGRQNYFTGESDNEIQKQLIYELDAMSDEDAVLVVATCNDISALGKALVRQGRFDRKIRIDVPDEKTRADILKAYFDRLKVECELDYAYLARLLPGDSGAKLECIANEAGIYAVEKDKKVINMTDVREIMDKMAFCGNAKVTSCDPRKLRMVAAHEAGHAIVALKLAPDSVFCASILPQGESSGHVHMAADGEEIVTVSEVEDKIKILLAGHVAERVEFGEYTAGSSQDIMTAAKKLEYLAGRECAYGYDYIDLNISGRNEFYGENCPEPLKTFIAGKLDYFDSQVYSIICADLSAFHAIMDALMDKHVLSREELLDIKRRWGRYYE